MEESSGGQGGEGDQVMWGLAGHVENIALDSERTGVSYRTSSKRVMLCDMLFKDCSSP